ncbi:MAG: PEP-CTERM sorting domain-containing protein [Verrucomicrobia bacterium]|nr:PEP-CTERM sorting domain-containing protein [Verrucomicrobiota bacterium]
MDAPVYDWTGALLFGADWRAELYGGATADSLTPTIGWHSLTRELAGFVGPGYFRGDDYVYVAEVRPGGSAWLQVKVWNVQLGATYEEAVAAALGGYGQSGLFYAQSDPTMIFPAQLVGLQSFSVLQVIPEPSTWALFVSGSVLGLSLRRWGVKGSTETLTGGKLH